MTPERWRELKGDWQANYGLDTRNPKDAASWWYANNNGMAPTGVIAALGTCIGIVDELMDELNKWTSAANGIRENK